VDALGEAIADGWVEAQETLQADGSDRLRISDAERSLAVSLVLIADLWRQADLCATTERLTRALEDATRERDASRADAREAARHFDAQAAELDATIRALATAERERAALAGAGRALDHAAADAMLAFDTPAVSEIGRAEQVGALNALADAVSAWRAVAAVRDGGDHA
jgi:hypothetical protein